MTTRVFTSNVEHGMGVVGLLTIALMAKLADADSGQREHPRPVRRLLARLAIQGVTLIGLTVDRVSGYAREQRHHPARVAAERGVVEHLLPPSLTF